MLSILPFSCQQNVPQPQSVDPQLEQDGLPRPINRPECLPESRTTCGLIKGKPNNIRIELNAWHITSCSDGSADGNYTLYLSKESGENIATLGTGIELFSGQLLFERSYTPPFSLPTGRYKFTLARESDDYSTGFYVQISNENERITHLFETSATQNWTNLTGGNDFTLRWIRCFTGPTQNIALHRASDDAVLKNYTSRYWGRLNATFPGIGVDTQCYFMIGNVKSRNFTLQKSPDFGFFNCNGSGKVCAVYEACNVNCKRKFVDLVERNTFYVEWDDTAISSPTVSIYLKRGSRTHARVEDVANTGVFNQFGLSFPRVTANTSGFYIEVVSGNQSITSRTFTVEDD